MDTLSQVLAALLVFVSGVIVTMLSFWLSKARHFISRTEAVEISKVQCLYAEDQSLVKETLKRHDEAHKSVISALKENSEILAAVKVQLAELRIVLQYLGDGGKPNANNSI